MPPQRNMFQFLEGFDFEKKFKRLPKGQKESFSMTVEKMKR